MPGLTQKIAENIEDVQQSIVAACSRANRKPADVQLVAVTKYAELPWVEAVANLNLPLGENRPQQLANRREQWPSANWHLIGQLQRNKAKLAVQNANLIHSIDSPRLLERVQTVASELGTQQTVLLQINQSEEDAKSGFAADDFRSLEQALTSDSSSVEITGLMTMAAANADKTEIRRTFSSLRILRDALQDRTGRRLPELSMGMSGDFEIAVEEGATIVRVGRSLYRGLEPTRQ